ncbi:MAG: hypothetical protein ACREAC_12630, partial [Blastocatellia bacterium]
MSRLKFVMLGLGMSLLLLATLPTFGGLRPGADSGQRATFRKATPNLLAPELYADNLRLAFSLVNLPGAAMRASYCEASYKLSFLHEAEFQDALKRSTSEGHQITDASQLPQGIFLSSGSIKLTRLATLEDRTHLERPAPFKAKVPGEQRTKFSYLILSYSIKIYDAKLALHLYRSGFFIVHIFEDDSAEPDRALPRAT